MTVKWEEFVEILHKISKKPPAAPVENSFQCYDITAFQGGQLVATTKCDRSDGLMAKEAQLYDYVMKLYKKHAGISDSGPKQPKRSHSSRKQEGYPQSPYLDPDWSRYFRDQSRTGTYNPRASFWSPEYAYHSAGTPYHQPHYPQYPQPQCSQPQSAYPEPSQPRQNSYYQGRYPGERTRTEHYSTREGPNILAKGGGGKQSKAEFSL